MNCFSYTNIGFNLTFIGLFLNNLSYRLSESTTVVTILILKEGQQTRLNFLELFLSKNFGHCIYHSLALSCYNPEWRKNVNYTVDPLPPTCGFKVVIKDDKSGETDRRTALDPSEDQEDNDDDLPIFFFSQ